MDEPLELAFTVACPPAHAFAVWTERTSLWWPKTHSVTAHPELTVTFEPHAGGRIYERTPAGEEHDWGEIVEWDPPHRLAYRWHLRQDRGGATRRPRPSGRSDFVDAWRRHRRTAGIEGGVRTPRSPRMSSRWRIAHLR